MKILIADDEPMARMGLIHMLDELYPGKHYYFEAKNGKEMMKSVTKLRPDVAFVDIKMPVMDGLTAIEQSKLFSPDTSYFILSGYADFEYACKALKMGTTEYLLKPIRIEELRRIIDITEQKTATLTAQRRIGFEQDIHLALNTVASEIKNISFAISGQTNQIGVYVFNIDGKDATNKSIAYHELSKKISEGMDRQIENDILYSVHSLATSELFLVTTSHAIRVNAFLEKLLVQAGGTVTCIYQNNLSMESLHDAVDRLLQGMAVRAVYGYGKLLCFDHKLLEKAIFSKIFTDKLINLCNAFKTQDEIDFKHTLNQMYTDKIHRNIFENADKSCLTTYLAFTLGIQVDIFSYSGFIHSLINCSESMYNNFAYGSQMDIFESMKDYIRDHYMNEIGIHSIADHYKISPNYFSKIFHEQVGCKFIDYLTQVRIANGKRIFSTHPNITVKEVAEMVGYKSVCHFTKTFIKLTGFLPSEYVSKLRS